HPVRARPRPNNARRGRSSLDPTPHVDEPLPDRRHERHQLHRSLFRIPWAMREFVTCRGVLRPMSAQTIHGDELQLDVQAQAPADRAWVHHAIGTLEQESARSADTHLLKLAFPAFTGIDFYFKDEATHPTGSLKHRLARSLFLYALCNGRLRTGQTVVD